MCTGLSIAYKLHTHSTAVLILILRKGTLMVTVVRVVRVVMGEGGGGGPQA